MTVFSLFVPGLPAPAGSKTAIPLYRRDGAPLMKNGRVIVNVKDSCKRTKPWQALVASMAADVWKDPPLDCALKLRVTFVMPRPKSHFRTGKHANQLRDDAPFWHTTKPDSLKLRRAIEDALTGIVWVDDARVALGTDEKLYDDKLGVLIQVDTLAQYPKRRDAQAEPVGQLNP